MKEYCDTNLKDFIIREEEESQKYVFEIIYPKCIRYLESTLVKEAKMTIFLCPLINEQHFLGSALSFAKINLSMKSNQ